MSTLMFVLGLLQLLGYLALIVAVAIALLAVAVFVIRRIPTPELDNAIPCIECNDIFHVDDLNRYEEVYVCHDCAVKNLHIDDAA